MASIITYRHLAAGVLVGFAALGSCIARIDARVPSWAVCRVNSDCTLAASSCCAPCGEPALDDVDGVNRTRLDEHSADVCPDPRACPMCPVANNPDLLATCRSGVCDAVDVGREDASACHSDADCRLRTTGCCECGGSTAAADLVAIAVDGEQAYQALVCDPFSACPECAPVYPANAQPYCAADAHCAVRIIAESSTSSPRPKLAWVDPTRPTKRCSDL